MDMRNNLSGTVVMVVLLFLGLMCSGGCFTGAKKLLYEVKGGEGKVTVIHEPLPAALLDYENIQIESFSNQVTPLVPDDTPKLIHDAMIKVLSEEPQLYRVNPGDDSEGPTLIVRGTIIHYQTSGGLSSILSSYSQLICRIKLIDGQTGEVIGDANCVGYSKAVARSGLEELAEGVAEALEKWLTTEPKEKKKGIRSFVSDCF